MSGLDQETSRSNDRLNTPTTFDCDGGSTYVADCLHNEGPTVVAEKTNFPEIAREWSSEEIEFCFPSPPHSIPSWAFQETLSYLNSNFGEDDDDRDYIPQEDLDDGIVRLYETRSRVPVLPEEQDGLFNFDSDFGLDSFVAVEFRDDDPLSLHSLQDIGSDFQSALLNDTVARPADENCLATTLEVSDLDRQGTVGRLVPPLATDDTTQLQPLNIYHSDTEGVSSNNDVHLETPRSASVERLNLVNNVQDVDSCKVVNVEVPGTESATLLDDTIQKKAFSEEEKSQLLEQMRKHVQLLAQLAVFGKLDPKFHDIARLALDLLLDLKSSCANGQATNSFFYTVNLIPAVAVAEAKAPAFVENAVALNRSQSDWVASTVATSHAFLFPSLLPSASLSQLKSGSAQHKRIHFFASEDRLLALGFAQFWPLESCYDLIASHCVPAKDKINVYNRLRNLRNARQDKLFKALIAHKTPVFPATSKSEAPEQNKLPSAWSESVQPKWLQKWVKTECRRRLQVELNKTRRIRTMVTALQKAKQRKLLSKLKH